MPNDRELGHGHAHECGNVSLDESQVAKSAMISQGTELPRPYTNER
jgi:hypothetical protein